jgi:C-terminal binding protein
MSIIAITDYFTEFEIEKSILGDLIGLEPTADTEILLVWHEKIDKNYIEGLPKLRAVQRYGVGFDTLDIEYLKSRNIICCNNPDYGVDEVSDTAIAMILNIARGVLKYDNSAKNLISGWQENIDEKIKRSSEMLVGIIGAGRIGGSVIRKANAIGFQTIFYDPYKERGYEKMIQSKRVDSLNELLEISDIVTLHCPLNEETKALINSSTINKMKKGASLINTARGGLIESNDIIFKALLDNSLSNCALDVLSKEPPSLEDALINAWRKNDSRILGRLSINPHTSYYSQQSIIELRENAAKNALRILQNKLFFNRIC